MTPPLAAINVGDLLGGTGILMGALAAGIGILRLCWSGAKSIEKVPGHIERVAKASELIATETHATAQLASSLIDVREGQEQIRITMSALAARQDEAKAEMVQTKGELLQAIECTRGGNGRQRQASNQRCDVKRDTQQELEAASREPEQ
jgi:hypothetical protein